MAMTESSIGRIVRLASVGLLMIALARPARAQSPEVPPCRSEVFSGRVNAGDDFSVAISPTLTFRLDSEAVAANPAGWTMRITGVAASQIPVAPPEHEELEALLLEQAGALLERFGDTFYALGLYLDADGEPLGVSARAWPSFDAPPEEWADSLVAGMGEYRPDMHSAAYLLDEWRTVDPVREDSTFAVFHFETPTGLCLETNWRYAWSADGHTVWTPEERRICEVRIWR